MIHATKARLRTWMEVLLHIHDSPTRTAAAFALGTFLGFGPLLGLHTVLGILLAVVFRLNRVAVLLGVYANLPWIIAQWYALMTALGAWMLGTHLPEGLTGSLRNLFLLSPFGGAFWAELAHLLRPLLWPYALGSTAGAAVLALVSYPVARGFIQAGRRYAAEYHRHHPHSPPVDTEDRPDAAKAEKR